MEVLIVNAKENTIKKADINNNLETFYEIIETDSISIISRNINGKMTQIICDEEGKLKADQYVSAICNNEFLVGNLIIKSQDKSIIDDFNKYGVIQYEII